MKGTRHDNDDLAEWQKLTFHNGKPIDSHKKIHKALIPVCDNPQKYPPRRIIDTDVNSDHFSITVLRSGYVFLYREDDTCLGVAVAPSTIGISGAYAKFYNQNIAGRYYFMTGSVCLIQRCSVEMFAVTIERNNLWHEIARILASNLLLMEANSKILLSKNAHTTVKLILIELSRYSEHAIKNINVQEYIQQRTGLSRSIIMKILSELKQNKEIDIQRGRLISISQGNFCQTAGSDHVSS